MNVYLRTFGCRANHYDTEAVRAMVEASGHAVVDTVDDADAAVFNSCAVTSDAEAELRKVVRRAARERPGLKSVVMGCAAALDDDRPANLQLRALPTVERVVGGADLVAVASALDLRLTDSSILTRHQSGTRALLRIQDGCDEHCTFCATTIARGANRSRPIDEIVREASVLAARHAEIVITGIHIGTYGADIGSSLGSLMQRLVRSVSNARFRLSSIEATEVDDALIELLTNDPRHLVPHIHAPLQSGSDRLLRRMGRNWYTSATYAKRVERLAARCAVLGLGADIIAGFPGETDADHAASIKLVESLPFTYLHVFPFSLRPGTAAERLPDRVPSSVANARAADLRRLGERNVLAHATARAGGSADVIAIGPAEATSREGLTEDFLSVALEDASIPRGTRFAARLYYCEDGHPDRSEGSRLVARPTASREAVPNTNEGDPSLRSNDSLH